MPRGLNGSYVLRDWLVSGVAEALDAGWGGERHGVVGKVVGVRWEGLKSHAQQYDFTGKEAGNPGSPFEKGGDLVLIR